MTAEYLNEIHNMEARKGSQESHVNMWSSMQYSLFYQKSENDLKIFLPNFTSNLRKFRSGNLNGAQVKGSYLSLSKCPQILGAFF